MIFARYRKSKALFSMLFLIWLLSGCSENAENGEGFPDGVVNETRLTKEDLLKKRAQERMDALISMDWEKAYAFLSPARRKIFPYSVFVKRMQVSAIMRKKAVVSKMDCESDACDVSLRLTYIYIGGVVTAMQGQENTSIVHEKWVFSQGNWWYIPE